MSASVFHHPDGDVMDSRPNSADRGRIATWIVCLVLVTVLAAAESVEAIEDAAGVEAVVCVPGVRFSPTHLLPVTGTAERLRLHVAANGDVHLVYFRREGNRAGIQYRRLRDGVWSEEQTVASGEDSRPIHFADVAGDSLGNAMVVWVNQRRNLFFACEIADAREVRHTHRRETSNALRASVTVDHHDRFWAMFREKLPAERNHIFAKRFAAAEWERVLHAPPDGREGQRQPHLAAAPDGRLYLGYRWMEGGSGNRRLAYRVYDPQADHWSDIQNHFRGPGKPWGPQIFFDPQGRPHMVFASGAALAYRLPDGEIRSFPALAGGEDGWPPTGAVLDNGALIIIAGSGQDYHQPAPAGKVHMLVTPPRSTDAVVHPLLTTTGRTPGWPVIAGNRSLAIIAWQQQGGIAWRTVHAAPHTGSSGPEDASPQPASSRSASPAASNATTASGDSSVGEPAAGTSRRTRVSIDGRQWLINGRPVHEGTPAAGLLMNVRMVNAVFEDESGLIRQHVEAFDPDKNTARFIRRIPEYVASGVAAFTLSLQGGMPGYEGAINSAFQADGSLRDSYMQRVARVIEACDEHGAVVILGCFYQRQHSHERALAGRQAMKEAVANVARWITASGFKNVVLEISNEYSHGGFRRWNDGAWLRSAAGQVELIRHAKQTAPDLLVSTSGMGGGRIADDIGKASDFILIHFNNTGLGSIPERAQEAQRFGKPVVCNEDNKVGEAGAEAARLSVRNRAGWGFMHSRKNQYVPFEFDGAADDPVVYQTMRELTSKDGVATAETKPAGLFIVITDPKDGDVFKKGQPVTVRAEISGQQKEQVQEVQFFANDKLIGKSRRGPWEFVWKEPAAGTHDLTAVALDRKGSKMAASVAVDIVVQ
jgi:hypothetical protein